MSFKLRTVLTVIFATLSLLVIVTIGSIFSKKSFVAVETEIGHSLEGTAAQAADKLDRFMYARSGEMNLLGDMSSLKDKFNAVDIQILLDQMQNSFPTFSWIGYMDPKGNVLAATDAVLLGKNLSERPVFQEGIKGKFIGTYIMQCCWRNCCRIHRESRCNLWISAFRSRIVRGRLEVSWQLI